MSNPMALEHTHFRQMKKHLSNVEKEWNLGALAGVKDELKELTKMSRQIEEVIKNQLYYNLDTPAKEKVNEENNKTEGRGSVETV